MQIIRVRLINSMGKTNGCQDASVEVLKEGLEMTAEKFKNSNMSFDPSLVAVVSSEYGSWINTEKLVEKCGWNSDTQFINNKIHENAGLISAGEYYNG